MRLFLNQDSANRQNTNERIVDKANGFRKGTILGAGVGMILGAALGNAGVGMVLGAGCGLVFDIARGQAGKQ